MSVGDSLSYTVSTEVSVPAREAFDYLSDPLQIGRWALGCLDTRPTEKTGLFKGTSIFDGSEAWVRVETDPKRLLIDYHVGDSETQLPRISTRIMPGGLCNRDRGRCIVTMTAWRPGDMDDPRWLRLCATHETEIFIIREHLEHSGKGLFSK